MKRELKMAAQGFHSFSLLKLKMGDLVWREIGGTVTRGCWHVQMGDMGGKYQLPVGFCFFFFFFLYSPFLAPYYFMSVIFWCQIHCWLAVVNMGGEEEEEEALERHVLQSRLQSLVVSTLFISFSAPKDAIKFKAPSLSWVMMLIGANNREPLIC
ncbi:unnamed protein product [Linum tenue]|uniref:Uncharacterized protein n=1 Tax=Linum tenue TaxID=586396 RepID=A0AAV0NXX5_9ROSI|nr:unnamed protein product [Linum tenue]